MCLMFKNWLNFSTLSQLNNYKITILFKFFDTYYMHMKNYNTYSSSPKSFTINIK